MFSDSQAVPLGAEIVFLVLLKYLERDVVLLEVLGKANPTEASSND